MPQVLMLAWAAWSLQMVLIEGKLVGCHVMKFYSLAVPKHNFLCLVDLSTLIFHKKLLIRSSTLRSPKD